MVSGILFSQLLVLTAWTTDRLCKFKIFSLGLPNKILAMFIINKMFIKENGQSGDKTNRQGHFPKEECVVSVCKSLFE